MRASSFFFRSHREDPQDADTRAVRWLTRANTIQKLASGIYTFLPLGLRVLKKIEKVIREEMEALGAQEILMPSLVPAQLLQESGRWSAYGKELMRLKDRSCRDFALAPTHEEVVADLVRRSVDSYRQLPVILYQIQMKFRDEMRPRFGLLRAREFLMKDAYSFEPSAESLQITYEKMRQAYLRIFERVGLSVIVVEASPGAIGGDLSHEFMVPAESGEDILFLCSHCSYAANRERAESLPRNFEEENSKGMELVETGKATSVAEVSKALHVLPRQLLKTLLLTTPQEVVAAVLRGDRELNPEKLQRALGVPWVAMASPEEVRDVTGAPLGFSGPVGLSLRTLCDEEVASVRGGVVGANREGFHLTHVNAGRDFPIREVADLRMASAADSCRRCGRGRLREEKGIEVGHIFKLGVKYTQPMQVQVLTAEGAQVPVVMGCYGIGVSRILAAVAETCSDEQGLRFGKEIAPFFLHILCVNQEDEALRSAADTIYQEAQSCGYEVFYDDRSERAGVKFKDADLMGSSWQVIVGKKLRKGLVEVKHRLTGESLDVPQGELFSLLDAFQSAEAKDPRDFFRERRRAD